MKTTVVFISIALLLNLTACSSESAPSSQVLDDSEAAGNGSAPLHRNTSDSEPVLSIPSADLGVPQWAGQRADEPFDVREFLESRMPPAGNAAPLYLEALADISTDMEQAYTPGEWQARLPSVEDLESRIEDLSARIQRDPESVTTEDIEQLLADAQSAVQKLDKAQEKPTCVFETELGIAPMHDHAFAARQVYWLARIQIYYASQSGRFDEAEQAIHRAFRLARDLRRRGDSVVQLVSLMTDVVVLSSIREYTLKQPNLTVEQCDRLLHLIAEHQRRELDVLGEAIRMEYIGWRELHASLQRGDIDFSDAGFEEAIGVSGDAIDWEAELTMLSHITTAYLEISEQPYHKVLQAGQVHAAISAKLHDSDLQVLPVLYSSAFDRLQEFVANRRARQAGTQMLIAIRRYELAKGTLPEGPSVAATEAGLDGIPIDPYSGQPMSYAVVDDRPVVYSVGPDQKDDGGLVDWNGGEQPGDFIFTIGK